MIKLSPDGKVVLSRATPHKSAAAFREKHFPTLINFQDEWLTWDGSAYQVIEDDTMVSRLREFLIDAVEIVEITDGKDENNKKKTKLSYEPFNPKRAEIGEALAALKDACHRPANTMSPPCWLDGRKGNPKNIVSCANGLLDIETLTLIDQTSEFFTRTALPTDYEFFDATCPRFERFISEVTGGKIELANLLQEAVGYLVASDTSQQRVFFLLGAPRTGKGTFLRVLNALVGANNIHNPTIQSLASQFGMQALPGKSVAIIGDATCHDRQMLSLSANRINGISGEDPQGVERKHRDAINVRLPTRFVIASNHLPDFGDHSAAIATRLLFLPFMVSFVGREDRQLEQKLLAELPGILNWALDGLRRLRARGNFVEPAECVSIKARMLYLSNPVRGFLEQCCEVEPMAAASLKATVFTAYKDYCLELGVKPLPLNAFAERLFELDARIKAGKAPRSQAQKPIFTGLRLIDPVYERRAGDEAIGKALAGVVMADWDDIDDIPDLLN